MRNCPVALAIDLPKAIIALVGLYDMTNESSLEKIPTPRLMKQSVHTCTMNFAFPTRQSCRGYTTQHENAVFSRVAQLC